jgi:exosortase
MASRKINLNVVRFGPALLLVSLLGGCILWAYWPTLRAMATTWATNPRYSHGFFVPLFAIYLLWSRRAERLRTSSFRSLGLVCLLAAGLIRALGAFFYFEWLDGVSFLVSLAGLWTLIFGKEGLSWAWPSLVFLIFMVPLPYRAEVALGSPLQRISTEASTFGLQVFGLPAFSSGDTIVIGNFRLGIVEACNGLGISYMFLACSVAAAFLTWRPLLDRVLLIASAIPIALFANACRIITTGLIHETLGARYSAVVYHDLAGWLMLFLALAILYGECQFLKLIFVEAPDSTASATRDRESVKTEPAQLQAFEWRSALTAIGLGIPLVVVSGIAHGRWTDRWEMSPALADSVARIERLPATIGNWKGRAQAVDPRAIEGAGLQAAVSRSYVHSATGSAISVMLVCGRPGPVSVHTPEICYPGAGYRAVQPLPARIQLKSGLASSGAEFLAEDFENRRSLPADRVRICWAWNADGAWTAPERPRIAFATRPTLYKIYVVWRTAADLEVSIDESTREFLGELLAELEKILFAKETSSAATRQPPSRA